MASSGISSPELVGGTQHAFFFSNEFPQANHAHLLRTLHQRAKDRRFRCLADFQNDTKTALQAEIRRHWLGDSESIPVFDSMLTLASHKESFEPALKVAVEAALLTFAQTASLIGHFEIGDEPFDFTQNDTVISGLSIGLLAATALSASKSLQDLVAFGTESVRIAFRLGHHLYQFSENLDPRSEDQPPQSWAYVVTGLDESEIRKEIDAYNSESANQGFTQIFMSAADHKSVNVTGPPGRLQDIFRKSTVLRHSRYHPLPVFEGLAHGEHIFTSHDIDAVVDWDESNVSSARRRILPLLSSATGLEFEATHPQRLYHLVCTELMGRSVHLDALQSGLEAAVTAPEADRVNFYSAGRCKNFQRLISSVVPETLATRVEVYDLVSWSKIEPEPRIPNNHKDSKLAVVGMSCRLPGGADDNEKFWELMVDGRDTCTTVPADRFNLDSHYDPTGATPNATQTPYGNFIDRPGLFDPHFFNMSPREAEQTDPAQRLALITAYEALEMAGYVPNRTPSSHLSRVGTYYGQASDDWRELNASQNIGTYIVTGGVRAFGNGRINYYFKFTGPSINVDTACSSGLAAVQAACLALWAGEADTVVAGGLNVITDPDNYCGLSMAHFLSKTGQCKVWDKGADGYCRSDGIGSVVIKRLEDAVADNDNIIATILAGATNHSAEAVSITHPHAGNQQANYEQVMEAAGVDPLDVTYIELHGTGTQAGDATESKSVTDVFAPLKPRRRADQPLLLGSVKSNIGHGEAAAGIASFIKVLMMYQKSHIPPHIGIKTELNPALPQDLDLRNVGLNMKNTPWPRKSDGKRYSIVNSFGAHGGNTTILLEDSPERSTLGSDPRSLHAITVSGKSKASLKMNLEALAEYVQSNPDLSLGDLAYTTSARRMHYDLRYTVTAESLRELHPLLMTAASIATTTKAIPYDQPQVVFAFNGQGAIYKGAGRQLFESVPFYRRHFETLDRIARGFGYPSVLPYIQNESDCDESSIITQLSILMSELALASLWGHYGVKPQVVIGHSLGEYAALVVAGVISAADAIRLVGARAQLLESRCQSGSYAMLSVRASVMDIAAAAAGHSFEVSCINGKSDTVISLPREKLESLVGALVKAGVKCMELNLPYAFHSAQMEAILDDFEALARHTTFHLPKIPLISPLLKACIFDGKSLSATYLRRACRETVDFVGAIESAQQMSFINEKNIWIDIGPHPVAASFLNNIMPTSTVVPTMRRSESDLSNITKAFAQLHTHGIYVNWNAYFAPFEQAHTLLQLPKYRWNEKNYWIQYVGDWTLSKAFAGKQAPAGKDASTSVATRSALRTPFIHHIIEEDLTASTATLKAVSDLSHPDFRQTLNGHRMNGNGVVATCILMDVALTIGHYMCKHGMKMRGDIPLNLIGMEQHHPQVANLDPSKEQLIQVEASLDKATSTTVVKWYNVDDKGVRSEEFFGSATMRVEDPLAWEQEWSRVTHLVQGRIDDLTAKAVTGDANRLSKKLAYNLFRKCVDYSPEFHGMDSVVMDGLEAFADVSLIPENTANCHSPPHWIDSVVHLAGFIPNGGEATDNDKNFFVTSEMSTYRISQPLDAKKKYRSYVRMFPVPEKDNLFVGDVYIMEGGKIIGMVEQIKFQGYSRQLLDMFFTPADAKRKGQSLTQVSAAHSQHTKAPAPSAVHVQQGKAPAPMAAPKPKTSIPPPNPPRLTTAFKPLASALKSPGGVSKRGRAMSVTMTTPVEARAPQLPALTASPMSSAAPPAMDSNYGKILGLIASEAGIDIADISDEVHVAEMGVDSLMSLVLSERCRKELGIDIRSTIFFDCPTFGELREFVETSF